MGMAVGTIVGAVANFSIQFPEVLRRGGRVHYRTILDFKHPGIRRMGKLMLPAVIGLSIAQINIIVGQNLASTLETGSIVALRLANRLINFPPWVFSPWASPPPFSPHIVTLDCTRPSGRIQKHSFVWAARDRVYNYSLRSGHGSFARTYCATAVRVR